MASSVVLDFSTDEGDCSDGASAESGELRAVGAPEGAVRLLRK
jgi:hypothetical protein